MYGLRRCRVGSTSVSCRVYALRCREWGTEVRRWVYVHVRYQMLSSLLYVSAGHVYMHSITLTMHVYVLCIYVYMYVHAEAYVEARTDSLRRRTFRDGHPLGKVCGRLYEEKIRSYNICGEKDVDAIVYGKTKTALHREDF